MSTSAVLFGIYLVIGLLLMVVAVAMPGKEERAKGFGTGGGDAVDAALLIFIAILWPLWVVWLLCKSSKKSQ